MIGITRDRRCRPPWWPENEPWPHGGPANRGYVTRVRFFRRFVWIGTLVLMCALVGAATLVWLAAVNLGVVSTGYRAAPILLVTGLTGAIAVIGTLAGMLRRIGAPLADVMHAADRVASGDYDVRVSLHGPPPIRALVQSFNTMTARLQDDDRLRRDLMADVAHELRTPLAVIQGRLEGLLDGVYPRDEPQIQELLKDTQVLSRLIEDLRTLALSESGALRLQREPTDLAGLARETARGFTADAAARGVAVNVEASAALAPIDVDPVRIREVIANLLSNALRHTPAGGSVTIRVVEAAEGDVSVEVRDTGTGMAAEDLARAFDRFHKGAQSRGSGLGLTIAKSLVAAHGGEIHAASTPGAGTAIAFTVPREPGRE